MKTYVNSAGQTEWSTINIGRGSRNVNFHDFTVDGAGGRPEDGTALISLGGLVDSYGSRKVEDCRFSRFRGALGVKGLPVFATWNDVQGSLVVEGFDISIAANAVPSPYGMQAPILITGPWQSGYSFVNNRFSLQGQQWAAKVNGQMLTPAQFNALPNNSGNVFT